MRCSPRTAPHLVAAQRRLAQHRLARRRASRRHRTAIEPDLARGISSSVDGKLSHAGAGCDPTPSASAGGVANGGESCRMKFARGGPGPGMGDTSAGFKARKSTTIDPSDNFGAATPMPAAFFAIQSLAFTRLSSVPALSSQTVTENPPSSPRTRV